MCNVWEPDGGGIREEGSDEGLVGVDDGFLLLIPLDARHCFQNRDWLLEFADDAVNVSAEDQSVVEGHTKDFGVLF